MSKDFRQQRIAYWNWKADQNTETVAVSVNVFLGPIEFILPWTKEFNPHGPWIMGVIHEVLQREHVSPRVYKVLLRAHNNVWQVDTGVSYGGLLLSHTLDSFVTEVLSHCRENVQGQENQTC